MIRFAKKLARLLTLLAALIEIAWVIFILYCALVPYKDPEIIEFFANGHEIGSDIAGFGFSRIGTFLNYGMSILFCALIMFFSAWHTEKGWKLSFLFFTIVLGITYLQYSYAPHEPSHMLGHELFNECWNSIYHRTRNISVVAGVSSILLLIPLHNTSILITDTNKKIEAKENSQN